MKLPVEISKYDPDVDGSLSDLLELLWSPDAALNDRHLDWKYRQNPYAGSAVYVAKIRGRVVAMRGVYGARYIGADGEPEVPVICTGDLVIAPDCRGQGVFGQIMSAMVAGVKAAGFELLFNFTPNAKIRAASLAAGWKGPKEIRRFRRPPLIRDITTGYSSRARRLGERFPALRQFVATGKEALERNRGPIGNVARALTRWNAFSTFDKNLGTRDGIHFARDPRPGDMGALLSRTETDGRIRHVRDEAFFRWRFASPMNNYRFVYGGESSLDAFVIFHARHFPIHGKIARLADWAGATTEDRARVMTAASEAMPDCPIEAWVSSLAEADRDVLRRLGFVEIPPSHPGEYAAGVLALPLSRTMQVERPLLGRRDILDIDAWNVRLLDSDGC